MSVYIQGRGSLKTRSVPVASITGSVGLSELELGQELLPPVIGTGGAGAGAGAGDRAPGPQEPQEGASRSL